MVRPGLNTRPDHLYFSYTLQRMLDTVPTAEPGAGTGAGVAVDVPGAACAAPGSTKASRTMLMTAVMSSPRTRRGRIVVMEIPFEYRSSVGLIANLCRIRWSEDAA